MKRLCIALLCTFALTGHAAAQDATASTTAVQLNGIWWAGAGTDERTGALYALEDCLSYDATPRARFAGDWKDYDKKISQGYTSGKVARKLPVVQVFRQFAAKGTAADASSGDERYGNEFWKAQSAHGRRGFVQGYIACKGSLDAGQAYGGAVTQYVDKLDAMYNAGAGKGDKAADYTGSVASAIERVRDELAK